MKIKLNTKLNQITYVGGNYYEGFYYDIERRIGVNKLNYRGGLLELSILRQGEEYCIQSFWAESLASELKFVDLAFMESLLP